MKKVEISLVLSFYNEINNLQELINRIRDVSNGSKNFKIGSNLISFSRWLADMRDLSNRRFDALFNPGFWD